MCCFSISSVFTAAVSAEEDKLETVNLAEDGDGEGEGEEEEEEVPRFLLILCEINWKDLFNHFLSHQSKM